LVVRLARDWIVDRWRLDIYPLSLHDALPIWEPGQPMRQPASHASRSGCAACMPSSESWTSRCTHASLRITAGGGAIGRGSLASLDRKSTRLNSSHVKISYAVFCLKKKKRRTY